MCPLTTASTRTPKANNASYPSGWEALVNYLYWSGQSATASNARSRRVVRRERNENTMRAEYDFSKGKRGAVIPQKGKTRISIFIDDVVLDQFRARAGDAGR